MPKNSSESLANLRGYLDRPFELRCCYQKAGDRWWGCSNSGQRKTKWISQETVAGGYLIGTLRREVVSEEVRVFVTRTVGIFFRCLLLVVVVADDCRTSRS
jgi:hypothetical protein